MVKRIVSIIALLLIAILATASASAQTLTITNGYANCRSAAGAGNAYLGSVYKGDRLDILGSGKAPNGKLWYSTPKGWVCSSFVRIDSDAPAKQTMGLSDADKRYIASVVSAEARGESYRGQMAVAQVIYDRAKRGGQSPIAVVKAKGQFAKPWSKGYTESCYKAVCAVFDNGERAIDGEVLYFMMTRCNPSWLKSKRYVTTIGNHKFYR